MGNTRIYWIWECLLSYLYKGPSSPTFSAPVYPQPHQLNAKVMNPTRCMSKSIHHLSELTSSIDKIPVAGNGQQSLSSTSFQYDSPTEFQNTAKPETGTDQRYELEGTTSRCAKFRLNPNMPSGGFMLDDTETMSISAPCGIPDDIFVS